MEHAPIGPQVRDDITDASHYGSKYHDPDEEDNCHINVLPQFFRLLHLAYRGHCLCGPIQRHGILHRRAGKLVGVSLIVYFGRVNETTAVFFGTDNGSGHEIIKTSVPVHNHEHDGEEGDDTPQSGHTSPAFRPVIPGYQTVEFEEFGESDEGRDEFCGVGQGEGVDYLRRSKSSIRTGGIFL